MVRSTDAERLSHDLANVALALDALAEALESGAADEATAARLIRASGRRIEDIRDGWSGERASGDQREVR